MRVFETEQRRALVERQLKMQMDESGSRNGTGDDGRRETGWRGSTAKFLEKKQDRQN